MVNEFSHSFYAFNHVPFQSDVTVHYFRPCGCSVELRLRNINVDECPKGAWLLRCLHNAQLNVEVPDNKIVMKCIVRDHWGITSVITNSMESYSSRFTTSENMTVPIDCVAAVAKRLKMDYKEKISDLELNTRFRHQEKQMSWIEILKSSKQPTGRMSLYVPICGWPLNWEWVKNLTWIPFAKVTCLQVAETIFLENTEMDEHHDFKWIKFADYIMKNGLLPFHAMFPEKDDPKTLIPDLNDHKLTITEEEFLADDEKKKGK